MRHPWLIPIMLGTLAAGTLAQSGEELAAWLEQRLPTRGTVHLVYHDAGSDSISQFGFDVASRAWYCSSAGTTNGRDARGQIFRSAARYAAVKPWSGRPGEISDQIIEQAIPIVILFDLAERPSMAREVVRTDAGGWEVTCAFPMGQRSYTDETFTGGYRPPDRILTYHISPDACLEAIVWEGAPQPERVVYAKQSPVEGLPIAVEFGPGGGWKLFEAKTGTGPGEFSLEAVVDRAEQAGLRDGMVRWAVGNADHDAPPKPHTAPGKDATAGSARPVQQMPARPKQSGINWPVLGVGAVFVGVGIFAWVRRR